VAPILAILAIGLTPPYKRTRANCPVASVLKGSLFTVTLFLWTNGIPSGVALAIILVAGLNNFCEYCRELNSHFTACTKLDTVT